MKRCSAELAFSGLLIAGGIATAGPLEFAVHPGTTYQTITGFGAGFNGNSADLMNTIRSAEQGRAYDLLYGESGAQLNIIRLTVSPNANPVLNQPHHGWDWAHDDATRQEWTTIQPILHPGKAAMFRPKPILYAVPFSPPAYWKTGATPRNPLSGGSLEPEYYQAYADYLTDFLMYYHGLGADIDVLSIQNEPGMPSGWNSCIWTPEQMHAFLKVLAPTIRAHGLTTKLMLSEGTNWIGAWEHLAPSLNDPAFDILASHSYAVPKSSDPFADPGRAAFKRAWEETGKPVWMSEMSLMQPYQNDDPSINAALRIARYIHLDMTEARASAWVYCFAIFKTYPFPAQPQQQIGSMGVLSPSDQSGGALVVPKRLWAIANYSRFARPSWKLMEIAGPNYEHTGFVAADGKSFAIVAVNPFLKPVMVHYQFENQTIAGLRAFETSANRDLESVATPAAKPHGFTAELAPQSVTTFAGTIGP